MAQNDGGPAFPQNDLSSYGMGPEGCNNGGMTLRDWFAGQALGVMLQAPETAGETTADIAQAAYVMADAMIAARDKAQEP
jgi:hypothetical protein